MARYQVSAAVTDLNLEAELATELDGDQKRDLVGIFLQSDDTFVIVSETRLRKTVGDAVSERATVSPAPEARDE